MQAIYDITSSMKHNNKASQDPYNVKDIRGCMFLYKIGKWEMEGRLGEKSWGRFEGWRRGSWANHTGGGVNGTYTSRQIHDRVTKEDYSYIYIGPWYYSKTIGKKIRYVAHQKSDFTHIIQGFVSYDDFSKDIKEKSFTLRKDYPLPTLDSLCKVKWMAKFGYNTIAPIHYPGFFNKILKTDPVFTGELVEVEE